jgi:hypothetical protein
MLKAKTQTSLVAGFAVATLLAAGIGTAIARESASPRLDNVSLGQEEIQRLLPLMDHDQDGTVSKQEFMSYLEAEFAKLEKNKNGDALLAPTKQPEARPATFMTGGK